MIYIVRVDDKEFKLDITREGDRFRILLNNKEIYAKIASGYCDSKLALVIDNKLYNIVFDVNNRISVNEEEYATEVFDEQIHKLIKSSPKAEHRKEVMITVPMPGLVVDVEVKEGESIKAGQGLVIVEAMKMQNEIRAPRDGAVRKIFVKKGQTVNSGETLLAIG